MKIHGESNDNSIYYSLLLFLLSFFFLFKLQKNTAAPSWISLHIVQSPDQESSRIECSARKRSAI